MLLHSKRVAGSELVARQRDVRNTSTHSDPLTSTHNMEGVLMVAPSNMDLSTLPFFTILKILGRGLAIMSSIAKVMQQQQIRRSRINWCAPGIQKRSVCGLLKSGVSQECTC